MPVTQMNARDTHRPLYSELTIAVDWNLTLTKRVSVKHVRVVGTHHFEADLIRSEDLVKSDATICSCEVHQFLGDPLSKHIRLRHVGRVIPRPLVLVHPHLGHHGVSRVVGATDSADSADSARHTHI